MKKQIISCLLATTLIASCSTTGAFAVQKNTAKTSAVTSTSATSEDYGLADKPANGTILHCFDWKYNDIKQELPNIAKAGFTSVQTSPAQPDGSGAWYWLYQPQGFYIGSNGIGSKSELQSLCDEAKKYGINVIVDVVANHLNGDHSRIQDDLKDGQYWHTFGDNIDYSNRWQVVHGDVGMTDIATENSYVQSCVKKYVNELKSVGVAGIRWDAAKHIGLPSEGDSFWQNVIDKDMFNYGEILDSTGGDSTSILKEYSNYISFTDSGYGWTLANSFKNGNAPSASGGWTNNGISQSKLVYWAESHDTVANEGDGTKYYDQNVIDRAYAVAAARAGSSALYLSRPSAKAKNDIQAGQKGSTHFTSPEVAAVNHLHNATVGQKEYYVNSNNCAVVCRETGAVIVRGSGSGNVSVTNGGGTLASGTYKDEVSGSTFTVTNSTISGDVGSSGIAVIYKDTRVSKASNTISKEGGSFKTDTLSLTLGLNNAVSGTYQIDNGTVQTYTGTTNITIGQGVAYGSTITVKLTAKNSEGSETSASYTFTKKDPNAVRTVDFSDSKVVYLWNTSDWSNPNIYTWEKGGQGKNSWPGTSMTKVDSFGGHDLYKGTINDGDSCVIFNDGSAKTDDLDIQSGTVVYDNSAGKWVDVSTIDEDVVASTQKETQKVTETPTTKATEVPTEAPATKATEKATEATTKATEAVEDNTSSTTSNEKYGDVNLDKFINIGDVTQVQKHLVSKITLADSKFECADVDGNGSITIKDATLIQKYVVGNRTNVGKVGQKHGKSDQQNTQPATQAPTQASTKAIEPETQATTEVQEEGKVVYVDGVDWGTAYAYTWVKNGEGQISWPGTAMEKVGDKKWKFVVTNDDNCIIFSNGDHVQTADLDIPENGGTYYISSRSWQ